MTQEKEHAKRRKGFNQAINGNRPNDDELWSKDTMKNILAGVILLNRREKQMRVNG